MKEVFVHSDGVRVGHCKSLLEEAGIACFVRNEISQNCITGIPVPLFYPALCVINDADCARAREIIAAHQTAEPGSLPEWKCPHCHSLVPANFDACWNCQQARPPADA